MDAAFQNDVRSDVQHAMTTFAVPGIVAGAIRGDGNVGQVILGTDAQRRPLDLASLFPVASLTKLATALAVLRLVDAGKLDLDDSLALRLPEAVAAQPGVTSRRLLCHTSGLPLDLAASVATYSEGLDWPTLARACLSTPLQHAPGSRVQYSNVGYGVLAALVERLTGVAFPAALSSLVLGPLSLEAYLGVEPPRPVVTLADVRGGFAGTDLEPFNTTFWRRLGLPWAGLVTTLDGALRLVCAFQGIARGFLRSDTLEQAVSNQTDDLSGGFVPPLVWPRAWWGLGPDLRDAKVPHWTPAHASPLTFGHAGDSGSLAYCDPSRDVTWAILGARSAHNGWLLRAGPTIGAAILSAAQR